MSAPIETTNLAPERPALESEDLLETLRTYIAESKEAREGGPGERDQVWRENWDAYWKREDFSEKADWQAKEKLAEVPAFVERFVASIRQALVQAGTWYTVEDPLDPENQLAPIVEKKILWHALGRSGRNATGQRIGFPHTFGDMVKAGALMAVAASVTWDRMHGSLKIEAVDPRELYFDPTGRGLYRRRRRLIDKHVVEGWKALRDDEGSPIYDAAAIDRAIAMGTAGPETEREADKEEAQGHGEGERGTRKEVWIDEFLGTILDREGSDVYGSPRLVVLANEREVIRGPEPNPFWHGRDWIVFSPIIPIPFSVYGKTYVEDFKDIAKMFDELTNLILDATRTAAMNAFEGNPDWFENPEQLNDGVHPNKVFIRSEDAVPGEPGIRSLELGQPQALASAVQIWQGIKQQTRESASQNELNLGQIPPKGDITATEIIGVQSGTQALVSSIATDLEEQVLDPILDLSWWTFLQHFEPASDPEMARAVGRENAAMIVARREEFRDRSFRFKANGITGMLARQQRVRALLSALQVIGSNPVLAQAYAQEYSLARTVEQILRDSGADLTRIEKTPQERRREELAAARAAASGGAAHGEAPGAAPGANGGSPPRPRAATAPGQGSEGA